MSEVNNCLLPDDLQYSVEDNTWVKVLDDGSVRVGLTDLAQTLAGSVIHCRPQKEGKEVKKGKSVATVESGKWVGPVKAPLSGKIVEVNALVESTPTLLNKSPYKEGWIVRIQPSAFEEEKGGLLPAAAAVERFKVFMAEKNLAACIHCEGFTG
jgi:glycine cleavage system H protein